MHRHRLALQVVARIDALKKTQQLTIEAGRIETVDIADDTFELGVVWRGRQNQSHVNTSWLINCSGPQSDYENLPDPLVQKLLERGVIRADALHLGLDVTNTHLVVGREGAAADGVFALGPPTKGAFFESSAVPDIRSACRRIARYLAHSDSAFATAVFEQLKDNRVTS